MEDYQNYNRNLLANFFLNNQTYDVTNITTGIYIDVLHSLENIYNFTTCLYKRKDSGWGSPKMLPNGTVVGTGMIENILDGSADFGWAGFSVTESRSKHLDFLPVLNSWYAGLFIPRNNSNFKDIDWTIYIELFTIELWGTLLSTALTFAALAYALEWAYFQKRPVCIETFFKKTIVAFDI